jgi:cell pole-organizing protein PopZ
VARSSPNLSVFRSRGEAPAILSGNSAQAVNAAFGKLAESVLTRATNDRSVEDVTRELLRVMLKQWLDENLPSMVERLVREEIERVARTGR